MPSLTFSNALFRSAPRVAKPLTATSARSFMAAPRMGVYKESDLHHESRAEEIAKEHSKKNDGEWQDALASDSESIAKADRGELSGGASTAEELAKETTALANKKRLEDLEKLKKSD